MSRPDAAAEQVELVPSDPWDFVTENGSGPFLGDVLRKDLVDPTGRVSWLLRLEKSVRDEGDSFQYVAASPRFVEHSLTEIYQGEVATNFAFLTEAQLKSPELPNVLHKLPRGFIGSIFLPRSRETNEIRPAK